MAELKETLTKLLYENTLLKADLQVKRSFKYAWSTLKTTVDVR